MRLKQSSVSHLPSEMAICAVILKNGALASEYQELY